MKRPAAVVLCAALAVLGACGDDAEESAPAPEPAVSEALDATLVVHPPQDGRRRAVLRLTATETLPSVDVGVSIPDGCRVVAGAQRRTLAPVPANEPQQSFVIFECEEGVEGEVTGTVEGKDAAGQSLDRTLSASL